MKLSEITIELNEKGRKVIRGKLAVNHYFSAEESRKGKSAESFIKQLEKSWPDVTFSHKEIIKKWK